MLEDLQTLAADGVSWEHGRQEGGKVDSLLSLSLSSVEWFGGLVFWCFVVLVFWCFGVLVFWCFGVLVFWCCGVVVLWCCGGGGGGGATGANFIVVSLFLPHPR